MVKLKSLHLQNYCGYEDCYFDFSTPSGVKEFTVFYGPNGIGKSTCLDAIRMVANPHLFARGGQHDVLMRKYVMDEEYLPHVDSMQVDKVKREMKIHGEFLTDDGVKNVVIDNKGLLVNELPKSTSKGGYVFYGDADHPMSTAKFILSAETAPIFLSFCRAVYGYPCELASPVTAQGFKFFTDFVITKGKFKVHYKRMSAGEKKIATLISDICQPINTKGKDIILVDNVEMHVYFSRHTRMVDKLRSSFPGKQIITTSHSAVVIGHVEEALHFDLEEYKPDYKLLEEPLDVDLESPAVPHVGGSASSMLNEFVNGLEK